MTNHRARTPVIAGVGQAIERDELVTPVDLAERAAVVALRDAGTLANRVQRLVLIAPSFSPAGASPERELRSRLGLLDAEIEVVPPSGNSPQSTVTRLAAQIAKGELDVALVVGGEAVRSSRAGAEAPARLFEGPGRWAGARLPGMSAGLLQPVTAFAVLESAMCAAAGRSLSAQRALIGDVYARFTDAAAAHPYAWFREALTPDEIARVTSSNRLVAEPYTKRMTAFPYVDQGAALLVCSLAAARDAGVADGCAFVWSGADCGEAGTPVHWPDLAHPKANGAATRSALDAAGVGIDDVDVIDLYSCFPSAVHMAVDGLGLVYDDPRGLTVTGGLAYFGGPGANYSTHAIATVVERLRASGGTALVVATGSVMSMKHGAGVYGSHPPRSGFVVGDTTAEQSAILAAAVPVAGDATGEAIIEAGTVVYDDRGNVTGAPAIARLADGRRIAVPAAPSILDTLAGRCIVGDRVRLTRAGYQFV